MKLLTDEYTGQQEPGCPENVRATNKVASGQGYVELTWDPPATEGNSPIVKYRIYRDTLFSTNSNHIDRHVGRGRIYLDFDVQSGKTYGYKITAINENGHESSCRHWYSATPINTLNPPSPPRNIQLGTGLNNEGEPYVNVFWDPPANNGGAQIIEYKIYKGAITTGNKVYNGRTSRHHRFYRDTRVFHDDGYCYQVTAVNNIGESQPSDDLCIRTDPPGIPTFNLTFSLKKKIDGVKTDIPLVMAKLKKGNQNRYYYVDEEGKVKVYNLLIGTTYRFKCFGPDLQHNQESFSIQYGSIAEVVSIGGVHEEHIPCSPEQHVGFRILKFHPEKLESLIVRLSEKEDIDHDPITSSDIYYVTHNNEPDFIYPSFGRPVILPVANGLFKIVIKNLPPINGTWEVKLRHSFNNNEIPLGTLGNVLDDNSLLRLNNTKLSGNFYMLNVNMSNIDLPPHLPLQPGLYDLIVTGNNGASKVSLHSVYVIENFDTPFTVVHVTDTHIEDNNVRLTRLNSVIKRINEYIGPSFVIVTGDLTESGLESEFKYYKAAWLRCEYPVYHIIGNHDHRDTGSNSQWGGEYYRKYICPEFIDDSEESQQSKPYHDFCFNYGDFRFITFDSGPGGVRNTRRLRGLTDNQLRWIIYQQIKAYREKVSQNKLNKFRSFIITHGPFLGFGGSPQAGKSECGDAYTHKQNDWNLLNWIMNQQIPGECNDSWYSRHSSFDNYEVQMAGEFIFASISGHTHWNRIFYRIKNKADMDIPQGTYIQTKDPYIQPCPLPFFRNITSGGTITDKEMYWITTFASKEDGGEWNPIYPDYTEG